MSDRSELLSGLLLARGDLDRAAHRRRDPGLLPTVLRDPATKIAALRHGAMRVDAEGAVSLRAPQPRDEDQLAFFLGFEPAANEGQHATGAACVGIVEPEDPEAQWSTLREAGPLLQDRAAGIFTTTLALANWHRVHGHCARCGAGTEPVQAGWVRRCVECRREHFPRTDPAVIVSVVDEHSRLLLGRGSTWPADQFSVLAGFVEPGESFEAAAVREVSEESGVSITDVRYLGSQPWPFPGSLMIGVSARALSTELRPDSDELAEVRWVTRPEYAGYLREGAIKVPGSVSIARRLIERWFGARLEYVAGPALLEGFRPS